jgi:hypothetical protein
MNASAAANYADLVEPSASTLGMPVAIANALIEHESGWNPDAIRQEPAIGDASRGLTQILFSTARSLGFLGQPEDLQDPYVNVPLGLKYLAQQYERAGSWAGALSAYNGGWAPSRGMGRVLAAPLTVVLARDQVTGEPVTTRTAAAGEYANQPYVDAVLKLARDYGWTEDGGGPVQGAGLGLMLGLGLAAAAAARFWPQLKRLVA